jgi:hypothetical protein
MVIVFRRTVHSVLLTRIDDVDRVRRSTLFAALDVISDQRARSESSPASDRSPCARMAHVCADQSSCRGPAESADSSALFARRHRSTRTTNKNKETESEKPATSGSNFIVHVTSIFRVFTAPSTEQRKCQSK